MDHTILMCTRFTTVHINGMVSPYFRSSCGVWQGDPISPILFNLEVDALANIRDKAKENGHISGILAHLLLEVDRFTHLHYVNDTLIMVEGLELGIISLKFFPSLL